MDCRSAQRASVVYGVTNFAHIRRLSLVYVNRKHLLSGEMSIVPVSSSSVINYFWECQSKYPSARSTAQLLSSSAIRLYCHTPIVYRSSSIGLQKVMIAQRSCQPANWDTEIAWSWSFGVIWRATALTSAIWVRASIRSCGGAGLLLICKVDNSHLLGPKSKLSCYTHSRIMSKLRMLYSVGPAFMGIGAGVETIVLKGKKKNKRGKM
jgi:hypothetical protein